MRELLFLKLEKFMNKIMTSIVVLLAVSLFGQELYQLPENEQSRWISFENPTGEKGKGGMENRGAKGHAMDVVLAGESKILLDVQGAGVIRRMWVTISDRSPQMLRGLKIEMFWDGAKKPAVSAPFGDFFGIGLGRRTPFECAFFSDPEGRSFNSRIPMPFKKSARIVVSNESGKNLDMLFYDINYTLSKKPDRTALYFHCFWSRDTLTTLGRDFEMLPKISGKGRFLGVNLGVMANPVYQKAWWGEGEVKVYLDGDAQYPTLVGTGTEDYIGSAWGQDKYCNDYQGCLVADTEKDHWAFYRYHVPDPIYFYQDCRVTIQQIGGNQKKQVIAMQQGGVPLIPISIHNAPEFVKLLEIKPVPDLTDPGLIDGWTNFYRQDDVSAAAYFYLDSPTSALPPLQAAALRMVKLEANINP
jgi:hypothetical protein